MKFLRGVVLASAVFGITGIGTAEEESESPKSSYRFQPCSFWRYDFEVGTYGCSFPDRTIEVPDINEVRQLLMMIQQLQQQIQQLEMRIRTLESRP